MGFRFINLAIWQCQYQPLPLSFCHYHPLCHFNNPRTYLPAPFPPTLGEYSKYFPNKYALEGARKDSQKYASHLAATQIKTKLEKVSRLTPIRAWDLYRLADFR